MYSCKIDAPSQLNVLSSFKNRVIDFPYVRQCDVVMIGFDLKLSILRNLFNLLRRQLVSESIFFLNDIFLFVSD
jgi:hypothetical protein